MKTAVKIGLRLTIILFSAVTLVSGGMAIKELVARQKEQADFEDLVERITPRERNEPSSEPEPTEKTRNLDALYRENKDFFGWLSIPGTDLDYPMMHTPSDPQKYLRKNFYGQYSRSGVPFLDYRCMQNRGHLIIYGHNLGTRTMFGALTQYTDEDYLKRHPTVELQTKAGLTQYGIFAVAFVKDTDRWYDFLNAADKDEYAQAIAYIRKKSVTATDTIPEYGQRILTLSTCFGSEEDGRLIVVAAEQFYT